MNTSRRSTTTKLEFPPYEPVRTKFAFHELSVPRRPPWTPVDHPPAIGTIRRGRLIICYKAAVAGRRADSDGDEEEALGQDENDAISLLVERHRNNKLTYCHKKDSSKRSQCICCETWLVLPKRNMTIEYNTHGMVGFPNGECY